MKFLKLCSFVPLLFASAALAGDLHLTWDASPSTNVTGYAVYATTNSLTDTNLATALRFDAGTNLNIVISDLKTGTWSFGATAYTASRGESLLSNIVIVQIPEPPKVMRTLIPQWSATLTNDFTDMGFFKIRIE